MSGFTRILKEKRMSANNEFRNSISKGEKNLIDIAFGRKKPKSKRDKKLLQEINDIKKKGGQIDIPHD